LLEHAADLRHVLVRQPAEQSAQGLERLDLLARERVALVLVHHRVELADEILRLRLDLPLPHLALPRAIDRGLRAPAGHEREGETEGKRVLGKSSFHGSYSVGFAKIASPRVLLSCSWLPA